MKRERNGQEAKTINSRHGKGDILMFPFRDVNRVVVRKLLNGLEPLKCGLF
jgi:hypothetical protein